MLFMVVNKELGMFNFDGYCYDNFNVNPGNPDFGDIRTSYPKCSRMVCLDIKRYNKVEVRVGISREYLETLEVEFENKDGVSKIVNLYVRDFDILTQGGKHRAEAYVLKINKAIEEWDKQEDLFIDLKEFARPYVSPKG